MQLSDAFLDSLDPLSLESLGVSMYDWLRSFVIHQSEKPQAERLRPLEELNGGPLQSEAESSNRMDVEPRRPPVEHHPRPAPQTEQPGKLPRRGGGRVFRVPDNESDEEEDLPRYRRMQRYDEEEVQRPSAPVQRRVTLAGKRHEAGQYYIGSDSSEERKRLFMETFAGSDALMRLSPSERTESGAPRQDPYDDATWYSSAFFNEHKNQEEVRRAMQNQAFDNRYRAGEQLWEGHGLTNPRLYEVAWRTPHQLFTTVLFNRDDLVLKLTPLYESDRRYRPPRPLHLTSGRLAYKTDDELAETYNEIKIAFFLAELEFGYAGVLSLHFMTIVDWFVAPGNNLVGLPRQGASEETSAAYYQVTVAERLEETLSSYLENAVQPTIEALRAILFQIFDALEIAWVTHRFIHYDLHTDNVMLKRIQSPSLAPSPLHGRNFVYKRYNVADRWYVLKHVALQNHYVKLIDFGRSRCEAPAEEAHVLTDEQPARHVHSRLIGPYDAHWEGHGKHSTANRYYDVRCLLAFLLTLSPRYWADLEATRSPQLTALYALIERALDIRKLERDVRALRFRAGDADRAAYQALQRLGDDALTARRLRQSPPLLAWMLDSGNYLRTAQQFGLTPTQALDDEFFRPLRATFTDPAEEATALAKRITVDNVVVSFPRDFDELNPIVFPRQAAQQGDDHFSMEACVAATGDGALEAKVPPCCQCGAASTSETVETTGTTRPFCGKVCYEFHYLFGAATVAREKTEY